VLSKDAVIGTIFFFEISLQNLGRWLPSQAVQQEVHNG